MAQLVAAPHRPELLHPTRIFLAGTTSAPSSTAPDWRRRVWLAVADLPVTVLDPVRPDWGPDWTEDPDACAPFRQQVQWELHMQTTEATHVVFYFDAAKDGMVSLLELGLAAAAPHITVAVGCEPGYVKRGNIVMVCRQYGIPLFASVDELITHVRAQLVDK